MLAWFSSAAHASHAWVGLAVLLLEWVPVPGVDPALYDASGNSITLGMLGLRPLLSAFVVVEFAALIVPGWRRLRVEQAGRAHLTRAAFALGILLALSQAWSIRNWLSLYTHSSLIEFSPAQAWLLVGSLSGAVALTAWLGRVITERGIGSGLSVLVAADAASGLVRSLVEQAQSDPDELARLCGISILFVLAWTAVLMRYRDLPRLLGALNPMPTGRDERDRTAEQRAYRTRTPDPEPSTLQLRLPASGSYPIALLLWCSDLPDRLRVLLSDADADLLRLPTQSLVGQVLIVGAASLLVSWCFHRPARMVRAAEQLELEDKQYRIDSLRVSTKRAAILSTLILVAFALAMHGLEVRELGVAILDWGIVVAVALDLAREWRTTRGADFVRVADLHRVYVATLVSEKLRKSEIPFVIRGIHHRTFGQFFAPFVPMTVLVKSSHASQARELIGDIC